MNTPEEVKDENVYEQMSQVLDNDNSIRKRTLEEMLESFKNKAKSFTTDQIKWFNLKFGLKKNHPRKRLATIHREIFKENQKIQKELERKAKLEEIKY